MVWKAIPYCRCSRASFAARSPATIWDSGNSFPGSVSAIPIQNRSEVGPWVFRDELRRLVKFQPKLTHFGRRMYFLNFAISLNVKIINRMLGILQYFVGILEFWSGVLGACTCIFYVAVLSAIIKKL